jgi:hypothetical protein
MLRGDMLVISMVLIGVVVHDGYDSGYAIAQNVGKKEIAGVRPLSELADVLQGHFKKIVTYEEAIPAYRGDMELYGPGN